MSGLETAIKNALEKSDRTNPDVRARIYQSARQALDSGLAKQGITDDQVIATQRQRLELKIREIEGEERKFSQVQAPRAAPVAPAPPVEPASSSNIDPRRAPPQADDPMLLGGATREQGFGRNTSTRSADIDDDGLQSQRVSSDASYRESGTDVASARDGMQRGSKNETLLDGPPERAAKPRRRRGCRSVLLAWLVFLVLVGAGVWWAYSSGLIQQSLQQALDAANRPTTDSQARGPQTGFSDDWVEVFSGGDMAKVQAGSSASVEEAPTATGSAMRLSSQSASDDGDVAIEIPVDILRELAGKSSTIALTVQSGSKETNQFAVSCDFGSLGECSRHRFTAHQEPADVLLRVTFERSMAPNTPGRLVLNTRLDGGESSLILHSVRVLPGH